MKTFENTINNAALINLTDSSLLRRLLHDLQHLSDPVRGPADGMSLEGAHSAELPAILKLTPIAQAAISTLAADATQAIPSNDRDILLVKTLERMLGRDELTFTGGRLQPNHQAPVGSSITSTFTLPIVRG